MKNWLAAVLAALLVLVAGTAIASVPSGSSPSFSVNDPAVAVLASGQTPGTGGASEACEFGAESTKFCAGSGLTVTPVADGVCQVTEDLVLYGNPMSKEAGKLSNVSYGIGAKIEGVDTLVDENGLTTTPNQLSEQSLSRTRLVPVEQGVEYRFEPWIQSHGKATGSLYWDAAFVCFG